MNTFQTNLKTILRERNMTISDLAAKSGVPYSSISSWLGNRGSLPNVDTICLIADSLDCSIDFLVGREDDIGVVTIEKKEILSPEENFLVESYRRCNRRQREAVQNFVRGLLAV